MTTRPVAALVCAVALAGCEANGGGGSVAAANATAPDTTPPTVSCSVYPTSNSAWPNTAIKCVFSEAIDTTTLNGDTFYVTDQGTNVPGAITYDPATNTATLKPDAMLKCSSGFYVNTTTAVRDLAGNSLASALQWLFYVQNPPSVTAMSPTDAGAAVGATITATFTSDIDPATVNSTTFLVSGVVGTVFYDAPTRTAMFVPVLPLASDTLYTVTVTAGMKSPGGAPVNGWPETPNGSDASWSFSTSSADTTAPTVLFVVPGDKANDYPVRSPIVATFSEAMDPSTLDSMTFRVATVGGSPVAVDGTVSWNAATNSAVFTPTSPLKGMTTFGVTISGAKDVAGNAVTDATWTFTTESTALYSGYITNVAGYNDNKIVTNGNAWAADNGSNGRGLKLSWDVDRVGAHWRYTYMLFGNGRAATKWIGDFTIGTPGGFETSDLMAGWSLTAPVNDDLKDITSAATVQTPAAEVDYVYGVTTMAIVGVRWSTNYPSGSYSYSSQVPGTMFILTFETPRPPVWGNFFIRSNNVNNCGGRPCLAWNANFATTTDAPPAKGNNGGWVLVPGVDNGLPVVTATSPVSDVAVGNPITVTFSKRMDPDSVNTTTFRVEGVTGTVTYDAATMTATFQPDVALRYGTTYTVTVDGPSDDAGHAMATQSWTVTTHMVPGDLDGDGAVGAGDADLVLQIAAGNAAATGNQATLADVGPEVGGVAHPDGTIDVSDVLVILEMAQPN